MVLELIGYGGHAWYKVRDGLTSDVDAPVAVALLSLDIASMAVHYYLCIDLFDKDHKGWCITLGAFIFIGFMIGRFPFARQRVSFIASRLVKPVPYLAVAATAGFLKFALHDATVLTCMAVVEDVYDNDSVLSKLYIILPVASGIMYIIALMLPEIDHVNSPNVLMMVVPILYLIGIGVTVLIVGNGGTNHIQANALYVAMAMYGVCLAPVLLMIFNIFGCCGSNSNDLKSQGSSASGWDGDTPSLRDIATGQSNNNGNDSPTQASPSTTATSKNDNNNDNDLDAVPDIDGTGTTSTDPNSQQQQRANMFVMLMNYLRQRNDNAPGQTAQEREKSANVFVQAFQLFIATFAFGMLQNAVGGGGRRPPALTNGPTNQQEQPKKTQAEIEAEEEKEAIVPSS